MFLSRQLRAAFRAKVADHFELLLTTGGVIIAIMLTFAQIDRGTAGLALTFVVWLQGLLIWAVRRHCRLARERLIRKLSLMLQDRVNNQLTVMVGVTELRGTEAGLPGFDEVDTAMAAAQQVARELEGLSMQSLRQWEHTYGAHLPTPLR